MPPSVDEPEALLALAVTTAEAAGALLLERAEAPATGLVQKSSATDPATDADRDAEALIRAALRAERPGDALLGEEGGVSEGAGDGGADGRLRWIVDPLDGTVNFLFGFPAWSVSIACKDAAGLLVGVVHDPGRGETFSAVRGSGATLNGRPLRTRAGGDLSRALVATGFSYRAEQRALQARLMTVVLPVVRDVRRAGSAALDLSWVAAGRLDGYYEHGLNEWDWAAGSLLVREAGGSAEALGSAGGLPAGLVAGSAAIFDPLRGLLERAAGVLEAEG
jgi:myo-inositol-1(or 4)-monophosphatase